MTREHIFFIPIIFALGFLAGALAVRKHTATEASGHDSKPLPSARGVFVGLLVLAVVFAATHMFQVHGGARQVDDVLQGQAIFDQRPSFSPGEVYARLESFGAEGRAAYRRMTFTSDLLFPLALFHFLFQLVRFVAARTLPRAGRLARFAMLVPALWLCADLTENAVIYRLIGDFPSRHDALAAVLGVLTYLKFFLLVGSCALPAALLWRESRRSSSG